MCKELDEDERPRERLQLCLHNPWITRVTLHRHRGRQERQVIYASVSDEGNTRYGRVKGKCTLPILHYPRGSEERDVPQGYGACDGRLLGWSQGAASS